MQVKVRKNYRFLKIMSNRSKSFKKERIVPVAQHNKAMNSSANTTTFKEERRLEIHCQTDTSDDKAKLTNQTDIIAQETASVNTSETVMKESAAIPVEPVDHGIAQNDPSQKTMVGDLKDQSAVEVLNITNTESLIKKSTLDLGTFQQKTLSSLPELGDEKEDIKMENSQDDQAVNLDIYRSIQHLEHKADNNQISRTEIRQENITISSLTR